jgi:lipoic acid synthetase
MHSKEIMDIDISESPAIRKDNRVARPDWLKVRAPGGEKYSELKTMMRSKSLHTVCEEAHCPNIGECWGRGTATFMILGDTCTRSCRFCAVATGKPSAADYGEPKRIAESVSKMSLKHTVITSVTRDDLKDQGAEIWAMTIRETKALNPNCTIEVLTPDFKAREDLLDIVFAANPDIFSHNMEMVPKLYKKIRPQSKYSTSLRVLEYAKQKGMKVKTGIMVGIGETFEEVIELMKDVRSVGVDIFNIGQYLQPTQDHQEVIRFVHPDEFTEYKRIGLELGFRHVESGPLVRSSYHAEMHV